MQSSSPVPGEAQHSSITTTVTDKLACSAEIFRVGVGGVTGSGLYGPMCPSLAGPTVYEGKTLNFIAS